MARIARELGILREHAVGVAGLGLLPLREAGLQFSCGNAQRDGALLSVDGDRVAVFDDGNRAADIGLGRDVADHETVAPAAEATIGDEGDIFAQALAHDGRGR